MEKSIRDQIYSIAGDIELDLILHLEKAQAELYSIREELFDSTEPNVEEYKSRYDRYSLFSAIVSDYIFYAQECAKVLGDKLNGLIGVETEKNDQ